jgi:hypothetical protein
MTPDQRRYRRWRAQGRCVTCAAHPVVPDGHARCVVCRTAYQPHTADMATLWSMPDTALMALAAIPEGDTPPGTGPCWLRCCDVIQRTPDAHTPCLICGEA